MLKLGDEQLEVCDHHLGTRGPCLGFLPGQALGGQCHTQGGNVVGSAAWLRRHGGAEVASDRTGRWRRFIKERRQPAARKRRAGGRR